MAGGNRTLLVLAIVSLAAFAAAFFEVGMQNGGMGVGLATGVLNSVSAALGPAVFGTWMNITGSTLASWWRERPPQA